MSSVIEGVLGAAGDIVSGIGKAFKSITESDLGRAALIGAAIYTGYLAYTGQGWFAAASPTAAMGDTAAAMNSWTAAGMPAAEVTGTAAVPGVEAIGGYGGSVPSGAQNVAADLSANSAAGGGAVVPGGPAPANIIGGTVTTSPAPGFFSSDIAKYGLIQAGAGALQGAFSPNELDVANEKARLERENAEWRQNFLAQNYNVANINVGRPSGVQLRDANGNPLYPVRPQQPGIINNSMI